MRDGIRSQITKLNPLGTDWVRKVLKFRISKWISILGVVGGVIAVLSLVNEATEGALFDFIFQRSVGNEAPVIEKVFARESGEEIPPIVQRGGGIFLDVLAVDPEGDDILYEWVPPIDGGFFRTEAPSDQTSRLVFFDPPAKAGHYIVRVRVRDQLHSTFVEGQISVEVVDP